MGRGRPSPIIPLKNGLWITDGHKDNHRLHQSRSKALHDLTDGDLPELLAEAEKVANVAPPSGFRKGESAPALVESQGLMATCEPFGGPADQSRSERPSPQRLGTTARGSSPRACRRGKRLQNQKYSNDAGVSSVHPLHFLELMKYTCFQRSFRDLDLFVT